MTGIIIGILAIAFTAAMTALIVQTYKRATEADKSARAALNMADNAIRACNEMRKMIPEDVKEERARRDVLMRELNDEMERRLAAERTWNDSVSSILNYTVNTASNKENRHG